jgi:peptide/nickel transport system substrate-binding protein
MRAHRREQGMSVLRRSVMVTALAAAMVIAFVAMTGSASRAASPSASASADTVTLRVGTTSDADTMNPFTMLETLSFEALTLNYGLLFDLDVEGKPRAVLAADVPTLANGGISADGKTVTVKLRPDLKWSDGTPLTAADVAWTYNYYVDNADVLPNMSLGAKGIKRTVAVDPTTVRIECEQPKADLMYSYLPVLPEHIWKEVPPAAAGSTYRNRPPLVGSGPFLVTEWKPGSYLKLTRNPEYWGEQPAVGEIVFVTYQNAETMVSDLQTGSLDAAQGILPAQFQNAKDLPGMTAIDYNYRNWDYLNFNCYEGPSGGNPVLLDRDFRHALNYAMDREKLAAVAFTGFATAGTTPMPPDNWTDPDYHWQPPADALYSFDLAEAGRLLDEAGYAKGTDGLRTSGGKPISLRFWTLADNVQEQTAGKMMTGWFRELGLKIKFEVIDTGALISRVYNYEGATYKPDFDMYIWYWDGFSDPGITLGTFSTDAIGGNNEPGWSNAEYDGLNDHQARTLDPEQRKSYIWQMQELLYDQTPQIPYVYPRYLQAYNTAKWTGWTRVMNGNGPAFWAVDNQDTYLKLKPVTATEPAGQDGSSAWIVIVVAAVVVVAVGAVALLWRRRSRAVEE